MLFHVVLVIRCSLRLTARLFFFLLFASLPPAIFDYRKALEIKPGDDGLEEDLRRVQLRLQGEAPAQS